MARTPSKRWMKMVEKEVVLVGAEYPSRMISDTDAITLLFRQHAAFVRQVKGLTRYDVNKDYHENQMYLGVFTDGAYVRLDDLIAALQQGGKK